MAKRLNRNEFLRRVARRSDTPVSKVRAIYGAMYDEMLEAFVAGNEVCLAGFGTFVLRQHKGHPVNFKAKSGTVKNYMVLKFIPSSGMVSKIRSTCELE